ncbi:MAG: twin-arginine translocase TatA/TatE family subunit [Planctomycetota bacterium]|nr:MAG: twin-arginine translocase TatA/TatE family subunit [Planctomycetota bacterium]
MPFGIGPPELLIVLVIGVLLFGKNLPNVGRSLGKSLMEFKKGLNDIKNEVNAATYDEPPRPSANKSYAADDYDEPTAPKFEPPSQEPFAPPSHDPDATSSDSEQSAQA